MVNEVKYGLKGIDNAIQSILFWFVMNVVQAKIAELRGNGWTVAALADELGITPGAIYKWNSDARYPSNSKAILALLNELAKRRRIPKQRRYAKGSRRQEVTSNGQ